MGVELAICAVCGDDISMSGDCLRCSRMRGGASELAERRILTLCFVDLVASTALAERLGLDEYDAALQDFHTVAARVFSGFRGRIIQHYGDGILACFGLDEGAEDAALAGLGCALALVTEIPKHLPGSRARVGLHAGAVLCRMGATEDMRPQLTGLDLNIAAHIEAEAAPGSVMASEHFTNFISRISRLDIVETRQVVLKGTSSPTLLHHICGFDPVELQSSQSQLLERDTLIWDCLNARHRRLMLVGPAGIGKTSVAQALIDQATLGNPNNEHPVIQFSARSNLTRSPLVPVTEWLRGLLPGEGAIAALLATKGVSISPALNEGLSEVLNPGLIFAPHPELSLQLRRANRIAAAAAIIIDQLSDPLALMVFDDFHWGDADTREVISAVLKADPPVAGRVIILTRPTPETADFAATSFLDVVQVKPLSNEAARNLLSEQAEHAFPKETEERLIATSGGNPLFLRVLAKYEMLHPSNSAEPQTPPTIEATIQHLLSELGTLKDTVLAASIIGRNFRLEHLKYLVASDVPLPEQMIALTELGVIVPEPGGYSFQHILLRDCGYNMLPARRRRLLHALFARSLQKNDPVECADFPELLADHYLLAKAVDEAVGPCLMAGLKFLGSANFENAISYLEQAVSGLLANPGTDKAISDQLIRGQTLLAAAKVQRFGFSHPDVALAYQELEALVDRLNATSLERMYALYGLFANSTIGGRIHESGGLLERMKDVADPQSSEQQVLYLVNQTAYLMYSGQPDAALAAAQQLIAIYDAKQHGQMFYMLGADPLVSVLSAVSFIHASRGNHPASVAAFDAAIAHIDKIGVRSQLPWLHVFVAEAYCLHGDFDLFDFHIEKGLEYAQAQGAVFWTIIGQMWKTMAPIMRGQDVQNEASLTHLIAVLGSIGVNLGSPLYNSMHALVLHSRGELQAAIALSQKAIDQIDQNGEGIYARKVYETRDKIAAAA